MPWMKLTKTKLQSVSFHTRITGMLPDAQTDYSQYERIDVASLQDRETGVFAGDEWGEIDTRFTYGAFNILSQLGKLDYIDVDKAVQYILRCRNYDGGFGMVPGAESHAGQSMCAPVAKIITINLTLQLVFTCVGTLAIAKKLDLIDHDLLGEWLCERQLPNGGLNGRPEKLEDVCYSWWVLSSLAMIDRLHWIDRDKLVAFILSCQVSPNYPTQSRSWRDPYISCVTATFFFLFMEPMLSSALTSIYLKLTPNISGP